MTQAIIFSTERAYLASFENYFYHYTFILQEIGSWDARLYYGRQKGRKGYGTLLKYVFYFLDVKFNVTLIDLSDPFDFPPVGIFFILHEDFWLYTFTVIGDFTLQIKVSKKIVGSY